MPESPSSVFVPSSDALVTSSFFATSSNALLTSSDALITIVTIVTMDHDGLIF